ncbi:MAG TPA: TIGR04552 family protein [Polyangia bacterium]|nr:TIGR04552 family protein [Polyangia bacterium]
MKRLDEFALGDVEAVRLLLRGASVIDWHRLNFTNQAEVERFLRINEFQPEDDLDMNRLEELRGEAVEYLRANFSFRIPDDVAGAAPARDLLLMASQKGRRQTFACIVLKAMHVLHHLAGRELLFKLPVSDDEIFHLVETKVVEVVEVLRAAGHPVVEFAWSRKERDSHITKLLAKKESIAAHVYDKLRFRLVVKDEDDLLPVLRELLHRLIPFNYVIPGESVNQIVPFARLLAGGPLSRFVSQLQEEIRPDEQFTVTPNEFSGPGYRVINFVADLPVRIGSFVCQTGDPLYEEYGQVVFVLTEFQVVDQKTAAANEQGENSHQRYKERQHAKVRARLTRGLRGDENTQQVKVEKVE